VTREKRRTRLLASVEFVQESTQRPLVTGSVRCRAEVDGRRLRVVANTFAGTEAHCAWRVPAWTKGKRVMGTVAVQAGTLVAVRSFALTMG